MTGAHEPHDQIHTSVCAGAGDGAGGGDCGCVFRLALLHEVAERLTEGGLPDEAQDVLQPYLQAAITAATDRFLTSLQEDRIFTEEINNAVRGVLTGDGAPAHIVKAGGRP